MGGGEQMILAELSSPVIVVTVAIGIGVQRVFAAPDGGGGVVVIFIVYTIDGVGQPRIFTIGEPDVGGLVRRQRTVTSGGRWYLDVLEHGYDVVAQMIVVARYVAATCSCLVFLLGVGLEHLLISSRTAPCVRRSS